MNENACLGLVILIVVSLLFGTNIEGLTSRYSHQVKKDLRRIRPMYSTSNSGVTSKSNENKSLISNASYYVNKRKDDYLDIYNQQRLYNDGEVHAIQQAISINNNLQRRTYEINDYIKNSGSMMTEMNDSKVEQNQHSIDTIVWGIIMIVLIIACISNLFT